MRILVTGATGFIGRYMIPHIKQNRDFSLSLIVRNKEKAQALFGVSDLNYIVNDDNMKDEIIRFNPDCVIHLATFFTSKSNGPEIKEIIDTNILFTTRILEAIKETDCRYFINTGTFTENIFSNDVKIPSNLYSASKAACRPIIRYYQFVSGWKWINVIIYSPYGRKAEKKKVIDLLFDTLDSSCSLPFTHGEQILDFIHVDDIAAFYQKLLMNLESFDENFTELHLGSGKGYSLKEIAKIMESISGKKINAIWGALPYGETNPIHVTAAIASLWNKLNWKPSIGIDKGLKILYNEIMSLNPGTYPPQ